MTKYPWLTEAFSEALYGKYAHYDVLKALRGLTAEQAKQHPIKNERSIWDHLYHIVFWHDMTLRAVQGEEFDWKAIQGTDWLPKDAKLTQKAWTELVESFTDHLIKLKEITEKEDIDRLLKGFNNTPLGRNIIIEFQHNAYHIGQIVLLRKLQGHWPPPEDEKSP
ncbi:MAG: DinB family protein [Promethearchaeota archaeon]